MVEVAGDAEIGTLGAAGGSRRGGGIGERAAGGSSSEQVGSTNGGGGPVEHGAPLVPKAAEGGVPV